MPDKHEILVTQAGKYRCGLNEEERLQMASLFLRAGYRVHINARRPAGKQSAAYSYYLVIDKPEGA